MKHPVAFPSVNVNSEAKRNKFQAGVAPMPLTVTSRSTCRPAPIRSATFASNPLQGVDMNEASAAVAAESSTGTWTEVWSNQLTDIDCSKAKVYRIEDGIAYIACPMDLFEENSVVNIMSSIVGNVFGFKAVKLREAMELWRKVKFGMTD